MERRTIQKHGRRMALAATCCLLMGAQSLLQSCKDDVLTGQPSWLGNSIYECLQEEGNYQTTLRIIDDLDQHDVLSQTGSKTLFVATDEAYEEWFRNNAWGVTKYEDLTRAQKQVLLNNAMVNNAYLVELLSNASIANVLQKGMAMRRATAATIYEIVPEMQVEDMPLTDSWADLREAGQPILIFKDNTATPMIHFLPAYMQKHKITDEDLHILTNGQANSVAEAWVNGRKVYERDLVCKNGYIQKVDGVVEASPNMAEIMRQHPWNMGTWAHLIDRYSCPVVDRSGSDEYVRLLKQDYERQGLDPATVGDTIIYNLRYYNNQSGHSLMTRPDGKAQRALLAFDPGWNQYMYSNTMDYDMHNDCGAMIVPTNQALEEWWNGEGRVLQDEYGTWDNVPELTLVKLLNVNMISSFSDHVPSMFDGILDDAKMRMGITPADIDSCFMGCNGVIYLVNKVFSPKEYVSVMYPALVHRSTMSVVYDEIEALELTPYLNSMDTYYSLLLPTNTALMRYIDPTTNGQDTKYMLEFYYDSENERVQARRYECVVLDDGTLVVGDQVDSEVSTTYIKDRFDDLMDQLIIVGNVEDGYEWYKTRGGSLVRVQNAGQPGMTVQGGWQIDHQNAVAPIDTIYDMSRTGNGKAYTINGDLPLASERSLYQQLKLHPEFKAFSDLLGGSSYMAEIIYPKSRYESHVADQEHNNRNLTLFDNFNYTVYVPTNDAIQQLVDAGVLPTWDDYEAVQTDTAAWLDPNIALDQLTERDTLNAIVLMDSALVVMARRINDFLSYHVHDNSVAVNMAPEKDSEGNLQTSSRFETSKINPVTGRFYALRVDMGKTSLDVTDEAGVTHHVLTQPGLYNILSRDYWLQGDGKNQEIYNSSDAVIHYLDGVLLYESQSAMSQWRDDINAIKPKLNPES